MFKGRHFDQSIILLGLVRRMRSGLNNGKITVHYAVPS